MIADRVEQGRLGRSLARRLLDMTAQNDAGETDQQPHQERQAPAPVLQRLLRHHRSQQRARRRTQQDAADGATAAQCADQSSPVGRRLLDDEDDRSRVFAADRQALHHAQQREQDRRRNPERLVVGQNADQEGRNGHRRDREGQRRAAAEPVADRPDHRAADRPHQEAHGENPEGREDLSDGILAGKKSATDRGGEIAVNRKIIPFEHVADRAGRNDPARVALTLHHSPRGPYRPTDQP